MTLVLTTERLRLQPPTIEDFSMYAHFYSSDAAAFVGGPTDTKTAWRFFSGQAGHWSLRGFGWFMLHDTDGPVGTCGLHHPPYQELEIGWLVFTHAQGKGYATEAARAVLEWGKKSHIAGQRLVSYIDPENRASQAVANKLGAAWDGEMGVHDPLSQVWVHQEAGT